MTTTDPMFARIATAMTPDRRRAIWHGLIVSGLIFNATFLLFWFPRLDLWIDAHAWANIDLADLYGSGAGTLGGIGAFRYSPAVALLFYPATWLSWPALIGVYLALSGLAVAALTGRRALLFVVAFPPVLLELFNGNIHLFLALSIWAGLRWPAAWAFVLLTKVTPGIGVLWFAGRRDWRGLAIALGSTAAIVVVGVVIAPGLWLEWFRVLTDAAGIPVSPGLPPLAIRLPVAAALAYVAGRRDQAWLVPVAAFIALPVVWLQGLAILTASFPLYWDRAHWQRASKERAVEPARAGVPA